MQMSTVPAAYATDMALGPLQPPELFALATLRLWATAFRENDDQRKVFHRCFENAGLDEEAAGTFDGLLTVIAASAIRPLDVRCVTCSRLGEDEGGFMQVLALLQHDHALAAEQILDSWVQPGSVQPVLRRAHRFAMAMAAGELVFPLRAAALPARIALASWQPGSVTIH